MNRSHRAPPAARGIDGMSRPGRVPAHAARIAGSLPFAARAGGLALLVAAMLPGAGLAQADPPWSPPAAGQAPDRPADDPADGPADGGTAPEEDPLEGFMKRLLDRARPALDQLGRDLGATAQALAPVFEDLARLMDDARNYHRPERLENGDILIRRRADAPPPPPIGPALRDLLGPDGDGAPPSPGEQGKPGTTPPAPPPREDPGADTDQPGMGEIEL